MRLAWLLCFVPLLTLACGGDETVTTAGSSTTSPGTTGTSGTPGTGETGPVDPTTGDPATSTSTTTSTSTEPGTSTTADPVTSSTSTTTSETSSDDTGPILPGECQSSADCKLFEDCCECKGVPAGDDPPICKLECDQTICDGLGVDEAVCRLGQCIVERLDCDATQVICLVAPPACGPGTVPGVNGDCWSGECVPGEICNVVPSCDYCPATWMCVSKIAFGPQSITCEPIPADCPGEPDCECAGAVCTDGFTFCSDPGGDAIDCECINC
jgi:hypothetical protein